MSTKFLNNKYTKLYFRIVEMSSIDTNEYCEKHHIIPRSLGGSNDSTNIARLTAKQHYICHKLLIKMTIGKDRRKMVYAFWMMSTKSNPNSYKPTAESYSVAKKLISEQMSRRKITQEFRDNCRKRMLGKPMSERLRNALHEVNTNRVKTEEEKEKIRASLLEHYKKTPNKRIGQKRTEEQKQKMREGKLLSWKNNPNQGRTRKSINKKSG